MLTEAGVRGLYAQGEEAIVNAILSLQERMAAPRPCFGIPAGTATRCRRATACRSGGCRQRELSGGRPGASVAARKASRQDADTSSTH